MIHISLFSGIGGFDLAAEWMGWKNYVSCEINPFANKILKYYWPQAYHHEDITTLNYDTINTELTTRFGSDWRNDEIILTGGFPCQPFSMAGKRKGTEDERYLWGEMLRTIQEVKPEYVIAENVLGIVNIDGGLVFEQVCLDLEAEGYEVQPFIIPACAKNAPHQRLRCWFVAYSNGRGRCGEKGLGEHDLRRSQREEQDNNFEPTNKGLEQRNENGNVTNPDLSGNTTLRNRINGNGAQESSEREQPLNEFGRPIIEGDVTDTNRDGLIKGRGYDSVGQNDDGGNTSGKWSTNSKNFNRCGANGVFEEQSRIGSRVGQQTNAEKNQTTTSSRVCGMDKTNNAKGTIGKNWIIIDKSRALVQERQSRFFASINRGLGNNQASFGELANMGLSIDLSRVNTVEGDATDTQTTQNTMHSGCLHGRNEQKRTEFRQQRNTCTRGADGFYLSERNTPDTRKPPTEYWRNFPTQSPLCSRNDELSLRLDGITFSKWRNESIKGYGNAIVPVVAYELFLKIEQLQETLNNTTNE